MGESGIPPRRQAIFDNLSCEERVNPVRLQEYEQYLGRNLRDDSAFTNVSSAIDTPKSWSDLHESYFKQHVAVTNSVTFEQADELTTRPPIAEKDWIIRVERIDKGFSRWDKKAYGGKAPVDLFRGWAKTLADAQASKTAQGGKVAGGFKGLGTLLGQVTPPDSIEDLFDYWNAQVRRDKRPSFVAFEADLKEQLKGYDWPVRLCERLGLGHYYGEEATLALMRYQVKEVLGAYRGKTCFCAPTVLDSTFGEYFHPTPPACDWGFAAVLDAKAGDNALVAELLHRRIEYRPNHLWRIGALRLPAISDTELVSFRNAHIARLRRQSQRADFGIPR